MLFRRALTKAWSNLHNTSDVGQQVPHIVNKMELPNYGSNVSNIGLHPIELYIRHPQFRRVGKVGLLLLQCLRQMLLTLPTL